MENVYRIQLTPSGSTSVAPLFRAVQGDKSSRKIEASIYNDDGTVFANESGITATYTSKKSDGNGTTHSATISASASEFKVIVTLTEQDLACDGKVYATIVLKKSAAVLAAMPFYFWVAPIPMGNDVESTSDYQTMQEATAATEQATADAIEATEAAEQATEYATDAADTASNYNIDLLAEGYDATDIYVKGDYRISQGALYRCKTDILTPEEWTSLHWSVAELGADVAEAQRDATEGYSDTLTAGDLTSDEYQTDDEPYLFRRTFNGACNHAMDMLVGGTVAWNQRVWNGNFSNGSTYWLKDGTTNLIVVSDNVASLVASTAGQGLTIQYYGSNGISLITGHKYFASVEAKSSNSISYGGALNKDYLSINQFAPLTKLNSSSFTTLCGIVNYDGANLSSSQSFRISGKGTETVVGETLYVKNAQLFDLTQMFGSTIADAIYAMEQAEGGSGVAWFRRYFPESYYAYDSGTLKSVEAIAHRMVGKNLYDANTYPFTGGYINANTGTTPSNANWKKTADYIPCSMLIGQTIIINSEDTSSSSAGIAFYDDEKTYISGVAVADYSNGIFVPFNASYLRFTVSRDTENVQMEIGSVITAYEPYKDKTYKLDSSLTLRGIPRLVDGKLTYDGDTYEPSGQVVRRYHALDLGSLTWAKSSSGNKFYATVPSQYAYPRRRDNLLMMCTKYTFDGWGNATVGYYGDDKTIRYQYMNVADAYATELYIHDEAYSTASALQTALSGSYIVYELATPTTETASPYEPTQVVYADGTEEYISQNFVPVGHVTKYPVSIKQALTQIATAPSANGTYILKCTVSGGVASYSWVTE